MRKRSIFMLGIICALCMMIAALPQKAEAEVINSLEFQHRNLIPGMPAKHIDVIAPGTIDIEEFYVYQNGKQLGPDDKVNSDGQSVRFVVTYKRISGSFTETALKNPSLTPEFTSYTALELYDYKPDSCVKNGDGSYTATWNAVKVRRAVSNAIVSSPNGQSFDPAVGAKPVGASSRHLPSTISLVKYEWLKDGSAFTGNFQGNANYRFNVWLKAADGYAFSRSAASAPALRPYMISNPSPPVAALNPAPETLESVYVYYLIEDPITKKSAEEGTYVMVSYFFRKLEQHVTGVVIDPDNYTMTAPGETTVLTAYVYPTDAQNKKVTWSSSDTDVATVDQNGKVTAVGSGSCTIVVRTEDGGRTAACLVKVNLPVIHVTGVKLNKTTLSLKKGASETLTATVSPSNAANKAVTWKSSNTKVATVNSNGKVTAVAAGTATITVTTRDGGKKASCKVTVTEAVKFPFTDVTKKDTYYDAVYWAYVSGIVKGKSKTTYAPKDGLTRGEFCTMLWRMWGKQTVSTSDVDAMPFADAKKSNHKNGIAWCYSQGIIKGYKDGTFRPSAKLSRANIIVMLYKLAKLENGFKEATIKNPYTDVKDSHKNISAYKWAYENRLVTARKLRSADNCTRAEMATFLYEYNNTYKVVK